MSAVLLLHVSLHKMAENLGWRLVWEHDEGGYQLGDCESPPNEVLCCCLEDENGLPLAALGGIADPDRESALEVERELIEEALLDRAERSYNDRTFHNWMAL